jgi:predicted nucleotidyltransferase
MTVFHSLAEELAISERTLRRAVERGLIRASRPTERRIEMPFTERRYIETHWPLLGTLLARLRTRSNVRLAVLFGSTARGDDRPDSDVDLLVSFAQEEFHSTATLAATLGEEIGRRVQVVSLDAARRRPLLLADVLRDGRTLLDRDGDWPKLKRAQGRIEREARQAETDLDEQVAELAELVGAPD